MLAIEASNIRAPDGRSLFHIDDFMIRPGERIALLGQNAVGKTTLIKTIISQYQSNTEDIVRFNPQSNIGYYDQALALLDPLADSDVMPTRELQWRRFGPEERIDPGWLSILRT